MKYKGVKTVLVEVNKYVKIWWGGGANRVNKKIHHKIHLGLMQSQVYIFSTSVFMYHKLHNFARFEL